MSEHLRPWAGWLLRLAGLMLACCQLAVAWQQDTQLQGGLQGLPMLRLLPDVAAITALNKVSAPESVTSGAITMAQSMA